MRVIVIVICVLTVFAGAAELNAQEPRPEFTAMAGLGNSPHGGPLYLTSASFTAPVYGELEAGGRAVAWMIGSACDADERPSACGDTGLGGLALARVSARRRLVSVAAEAGLGLSRRNGRHTAPMAATGVALRVGPAIGLVARGDAFLVFDEDFEAELDRRLSFATVQVGLSILF